MTRSQAYFNGEWIDAAAIDISLDDLGFLVGATVVERLRTFLGEPFRVDDHLARLRRSLEIVGWDGEALPREIGNAIREFPRRNAGILVPGDDWSITAFVTPGASADAARPTVCVHGFPIPFANWASQYEAGLTMATVGVRQLPANAQPPELKCRSRMHYYLADCEAERTTPGARALLLDQDGFVSESTTANVVAWFADRGLVTPRLDAVLPGISQQTLFELADILGVARSERDMTPAQFAAADEIFLTSTSIAMLPVVELDGRKIGDGTPGPLYRRLLTAWSLKVGVDIAEQARQFARRNP